MKGARSRWGLGIAVVLIALGAVWLAVIATSSDPPPQIAPPPAAQEPPTKPERPESDERERHRPRHDSDSTTATETSEDGPPTAPPEVPTVPPKSVIRVVTAQDSSPIQGAQISGASSDSLTTDADGIAHTRQAFSVMVTISADGFLPARIVLSEDGTKPGKPLTVRLKTGVTLTGRVLSAATGTPIADAYLTVSVGTSPGWNNGVMSMTAGTDAAGAYRLTIPRSKLVTLVAGAQGYSQTTEQLTTPETDGHTRDVRLKPQVVLTGHVFDPAGAPHAGASVSAVPTESVDALERIERGRRSRSEFQARTDAEGNFELKGLDRATRYVVIATAIGHSVSVRSARIDMESPPDDLILRLREPAFLDVYVETDVGDLPDETTVDVSSAEPGFMTQPAPGNWRAGPLPAGPKSVRVEAPGFVAVLQTIDLAPGETGAVRVELARGGSLAGIVVDDQGSPVRGVMLSFYAGDREGGVRDAGRGRHAARTAATQTNGDGSFSVSGLRDGVHRIRAYAPLYVISWAEATPPQSDVRIVVKREGSAVWRVAPPKGAKRLTWFRVHGGVERKDWTEDRGAAERYATLRPRFDWEGDLARIRCRAHGRIRLIARAAGYAPLVREFDVEVGAQLDLGQTTFTAGRDLRGRVVTDAGRPVPHARVTAKGGTVTWYQTIHTNTKGWFTIPNAGTGSLSLSVQAPSHTSRTMTIEVSASTALPVVVLGRVRRGNVTGTVVDADGAPVSGVVVHYQDLGPDGRPTIWSTTPTDEGGRFKLRLEPGRFRVWGDGIEAEEVEVRADEDAQVELVQR